MSLPEDCIPSRRGFGYYAFGLYLVSNRPVPGLIESTNSGLPEVSLHFGEEPGGFDPSGYQEIWYQSPYKTPSGIPALIIQTTGTEYWLRYQDGVTVFLSKNASELHVVWPEPSSSFEEAVTYVFGPVMAIVSQLRGATCLHGCAVAIDDGIIALLGPQGAGKSTTAAAFARAGYSVAADDLVLLAEGPRGFMVQPAFPGLRLWPASVEMLFGNEDALPPLTPTWDKRGLNLNADDYSFQSEPLPLTALYLFGERSAEERAPYLAPVSGGAAIKGLLSNSWAHYVNKPAFLASQLRVLTRLARSTPLKQCVAHQDSSRLPELCRILAEDVRSFRSTKH